MKLILFLTFLVFIPIAAQASSYHESIKLIHKQKLYSHQHWHKLLGYKSQKSLITSTEFFLHEDGNINPKLELEETIKALYTPPLDEEINDSVFCKFPARSKWIIKQLSLSKNLFNFNRCTKYREWLTYKPKSISLIFATGYLENPASFYGHLLLKLNSGEQSGLLDTSINYGAIETDSNPILYIVNGLFGGYQSSFTDSKFYFQSHSYGDYDLRDMWEYELNLNDDEIELLTNHLWELMPVRNTYYFLNENCAFHIAKLLNLVITDPLIDNYTPWVMPLAVFKNLSKATINKRDAIKKVSFLPSRQSRFYQKFSKLNQESKITLSNMVDSHKPLSHKMYSSLSAENKIEVLNALFDYYEFLQVKADDEDKKNLEIHKKSVIIERFKLPVKIPKPYQTDTLAPHYSQNPKTLRLGVSYSELNNTMLTIRLRPVYYDLLGDESGRLPNSSLSMADLKIKLFNSSITVERFDIVSIHTLNISPTGLTRDSNYAWALNFGIDRTNKICRNCSRAQATGGIGKSYQLSTNTNLSFMAYASIHSQGLQEGIVSGKLEALSLSQINKNWKSLVRLNYNMNNSDNWIKFTWENSFLNTTDRDVRFKYLYEKGHEAVISYSHYW